MTGAWGPARPEMIGMDGGFSIGLAPAPMPVPGLGAAVAPLAEAGPEPGFLEALQRSLAPPVAIPAPQPGLAATRPAEVMVAEGAIVTTPPAATPTPSPNPAPALIAAPLPVISVAGLPMPPPLEPSATMVPELVLAAPTAAPAAVIPVAMPAAEIPAPLNPAPEAKPVPLPANLAPVAPPAVVPAETPDAPLKPAGESPELAHRPPSGSKAALAQPLGVPAMVEETAALDRADPVLQPELPTDAAPPLAGASAPVESDAPGSERATMPDLPETELPVGALPMEALRVEALLVPPMLASPPPPSAPQPPPGLAVPVAPPARPAPPASAAEEPAMVGAETEEGLAPAAAPADLPTVARPAEPIAVPRPAVPPVRLRSEPTWSEPTPPEPAPPVTEAPPAELPTAEAPPATTAPEPRPATALPPPPATPANPPPAPIPGWALDPLSPAPRPAEAPPPAPPTPPMPMRQVAPIAIALAFTPGAANGFQLALDPVELGRVEIRVQREGESHSVRVTAERPETLALLLRDRQELDRSLSDAGLRVEAKGIEFTLSPQSGGSEHRPQAEARAGASRTGRNRSGAPTETESPPPARAQRGLLDLNI